MERKFLRDVSDIQTGPFGSQLHEKDYVLSGGTPIVTVEHLGGRHFTTQNLPLVSDADRDRLQKYVAHTGDIVFSRVGSVDRCSFVSPREDGWMFSGRCLRVRPCSLIDGEFLYYYLCQPIIRQYIRDIAVGTTMPSINTSLMGDVPVEYPPLSVQRRIAAVLGALDDKIEVNRKICENLEAQAQALFKAWFVDFEPFGGKRLEGWKEIPLSTIADFYGGYSYKGTELQESDCAMVTIKNFDRGGGFKLNGFKEIVPSSKLKDSHEVDLFDTLVAHTDLTQNAEVIGNSEMLLSKAGYKKIIMSMDLVKVVPKHGISRFLLGALLKNSVFKSHCLRYVNGTTVLHLSKMALADYTLDFPDDPSVLDSIAQTFESVYRKIAVLIDESRALAAMRDALLPKLMSGELAVEKVEAGDACASHAG